MNILGLDVKFPTWTRSKDGQNFSDLTTFNDWSSVGSNLDVSLKHPILTPALLFVSKLFSQATFKVTRDSTGKEIKDSPYIKLIDNPNPSQTRQDLLEALMFTQIATGVGVLYTKRNFLTQIVNSIYVLNFDLIEFPDSLKKGNFINSSQTEEYLNKEVIYDKSGEDLKIKLKDLMFFFDLPNVGSKNPFKAESRITGLRQTLINTNDSLIAKNIILKSNGKELISGTKEGFPLTPEEKKEVEENYQNNYGVSFGRKRGIVISASVTHKSLHIALRDLGLDESVKTDGNIVFTALHIPKDIISLEAKKTTYNNFKESMASYVQNEMQSSLNSFCAVLNKVLIDDGVTISGSYEHLPIMQFILIEKYKSVYERGNALYMLRVAGIPDEEALGLVGLESSIKLLPVKSRTSNKPETQSDDDTAQEEKIKELINEML